MSTRFLRVHLSWLSTGEARDRTLAVQLLHDAPLRELYRAVERDGPRGVFECMLVTQEGDLVMPSRLAGSLAGTSFSDGAATLEWCPHYNFTSEAQRNQYLDEMS